jgi:hypothetical protein
MTPKGNVWNNAEMYRVYLNLPRLSLCGTRLLWVVVGRKWVKLCTLVEDTKMRISISEWNNLQKEKYDEKHITND